MTSNRATVEQCLKCICDHAWDGVAELLHDDYVAEWPQTGERIVGKENWLAIHNAYPQEPTSARFDDVYGESEQHAHVSAATPFAMPIVSVSDGGDVFTAAGKVTYANGETFHTVSIFTLADGKILKEVSYWAPELEAPEWRRQWIEPLES